MKKVIYILMIVLVFRAVSYAENTALLNAMKDELARSMAKLKLDNEASPYFIAYLIKDVYAMRVTATSGAITADTSNRSRTLKIDLRVGDYSLDNSNFTSMSGMLASGMTGMETRFTIDDDYDVLRRQLWLATDRAYKSALETLTRKKAFLQNTIQAESVPDFTKGEALSSLLPEASIDAKRSFWGQIVDQVSKLFLSQDKIQRSKVEYRLQVVNSYYVNSEGIVSVQPFTAARLAINASTQADDGMPLKNFLVYISAKPEDMPDKDRIVGDTKKMIADLLALRTAPLAEDYSGPVLFEQEAAGEFFAQGFVTNLLAKKMPLSDNAQYNAFFARMENPFLAKVNTKVTANFLSVKAVPTLKDINRKALLGSYQVDEEGVKCRDVDLVENGILKNLLTSRAPVKGFLQSNGHFRSSAIAPSVVQFFSSKKLSSPELKKKLIEAVKEENLPYGYHVKYLTPPSEAVDPDDISFESLLAPDQGLPDPMQFKLSKPILVYRIYADGKEELVRGAEFGSLSVNAFKNILATSDDSLVYDYSIGGGGLAAGLSSLLGMIGMAGLSSQEVYATVITPSFLIGGVDMKKPTGSYQKPPIVVYPIK